MEDTRLLFKSDYEDDLAAYYKRGYAEGTPRTVTPTRNGLQETRIPQKGDKIHPRFFWKPYTPRFTAQESLEQAQAIWDDVEGLKKLSCILGEKSAKEFRDRIIMNHVENKV